MRALALLFLALASTGCSGFVAASGTDLSKLESKSDVRAKFGTPISTGSRNGEAFETYHTHRKLRDTTRGMGIVMLDTMTLGLAELYLLPREVFVACRDMVRGQDLVMHYDTEGKIVGIEGNPDLFASFRRQPSPMNNSTLATEQKP